ncbi:MAG: molecular chaperone HtpG [Coxiellaceae bacterium]|jgi:molecular chaperone HtpG|nr:molecular chaperone HtpG [Coxiellaceae bacterium]
MTENNKTETLGFQTEVKQLLQLVTHSLYSNREVFLRELISNASDAADKLRFEALTNPSFYENDPDLKIYIDFDPKEKTITVRDNGIGMNRNEVIANLGTIAKSGTKEFLAALTETQTKDSHLIGQFGVGFYSSFVVADKVIVKTRRTGLTKEAGVLWESKGEGEFIVTDIVKEARGTEIILYLKPDDVDLLDYWRLRQIIVKYSDHIVLPILMKKPLAEKEKVAQEEVVNKATALWVLPKKDIKDDDYKALYKHISHDFEDPLIWGHNRVEGKLEYITLLYIPAHTPFDFWTREKKRGLKLYVQRVFIMDDAEQLLPNYLRFVQGIVDARDLPLNVSREILQNNRMIEQIRSGIIKRILDMLEKLATSEPEKYAKFWQAFGSALKEGMVEDFTHKGQIAKLLRFASTKNDDGEQNVTLDEYVARMLKDQDKIYYITAEKSSVAKSSPYLEVFRKNDIEVLLLDDRIDEWWLTHYQEHNGKKFQAIIKGDVDISKLTKNRVEVDTKQLKTEYEEVLKKMQTVLNDRVTAVRLSERLTDSPVCIVTTADDLSFNMQRIMSAFGQNVPKTKPILELNPKHKLIQNLREISDEKLFAEWTNLFYEQALLIAGGKLDDVAAFTNRMNHLFLN